ncbi:hypothetical protein H4Q26_010050, partial [Puccinia striiformis f. sp. tritici PST-130]
SSILIHDDGSVNGASSEHVALAVSTALGEPTTTSNSTVQQANVNPNFETCIHTMSSCGLRGKPQGHWFIAKTAG